MRISRRTRLAALSLVVAVFAGAQPAVGNDCTWHQWDDGMGGWIGYWDCGHCTATYVYRPGDSDWTPAGSDCEALPT